MTLTPLLSNPPPRASQEALSVPFGGQIDGLGRSPVPPRCRAPIKGEVYSSCYFNRESLELNQRR